MADTFVPAIIILPGCSSGFKYSEGDLLPGCCLNEIPSNMLPPTSRLQANVRRIFEFDYSSFFIPRILKDEISARISHLLAKVVFIDTEQKMNPCGIICPPEDSWKNLRGGVTSNPAKGNRAGRYHLLNCCTQYTVRSN